MKNIFSFLLLGIAVSGFLFSCDVSDSKDDDKEKTPVIQDAKDIAYVDNATAQQKMDIYVPENAEVGKSYPALFWLPGGAWVFCNKNDEISLLETKDITAQEYLLVKMNYRVAGLTGDIAITDMLSDIGNAISYLKKNAKQYAFNGKFGLAGASAGGHLAMLYGYKEKPDGLMFVIDEYGPSDFTDPSYLYTNIDNDNSYCSSYQGLFETAKKLIPSITTRTQFINTLISLLTGNKLDNDMYNAIKDAENVTSDTLAAYLTDGHISDAILPDTWKNASPLTYITSSSVPTLLAYGEKDSLVKKESQYDFLKAKLDSCGVKNYGIVFPASGHGLNVAGTSSPNETYKKEFVEAVRKFLKNEYINGEYKE